MDEVTIVSSAILGIEQESVFINGRAYHIYPPTIRMLVGAISKMKPVQGESIKDVIFNMDLEGSCKALSWFIKGDESLYETFLDSPINEVQDGLLAAFSLLDPQNFIRLSALQKNVRRLIARPK